MHTIPVTIDPCDAEHARRRARGERLSAAWAVEDAYTVDLLPFAPSHDLSPLRRMLAARGAA